MADVGRPDVGPVRYCADCSREAGEQVFGSAPHVNVWLALEYNGAWGPKAVKDSTLPPAVQARLSEPIGMHAVRPLLIRRTGRASEGLAFFVAVADELEPRLYEFALASYEELLTIGLSEVVRGGVQVGGPLRQRPLYFVCTNGKRDRSCAKYGLPLYNTMTEIAGDDVWQSSHLGGHRFAPTSLILPAGVLYGHLEAEQAHELIMLHERRRLLLSNFRGRSCYDSVEQAADYFLRQESGERGLTAFRWLDTMVVESGRWLVRFEGRATQAVHALELQRGPASVDVYLSSKDEMTSAMPQYELLSYVVNDAP